MGLSAASFAELGTRMPVSASEAAYVDRAFAMVHDRDRVAPIRIKMTETITLPPGVFICPFRMPVAGVALLGIDVAPIG